MGRCVMQLTTERTGRSGFTVVEVTLTVVVLSIMLALALPGLARSARATKTRSAAAQFASTHALARASAMRYGRTAELHIDAASKRFWVEVDTSAVGGVTDTIGTIQNLTDDPLVMTSSRALLCFDRRGLATTANTCEPGDATITFAIGTRADTVTTSVLGKIVR